MAICYQFILVFKIQETFCKLIFNHKKRILKNFSISLTSPSIIFLVSLHTVVGHCHSKAHVLETVLNFLNKPWHCMTNAMLKCWANNKAIKIFLFVSTVLAGWHITFNCCLSVTFLVLACLNIWDTYSLETLLFR